MRITCRKQKSEKGLARIGQSPRGYEISLDGKVVANVGAHLEFPTRNIKGWYFYARVGDKSINTYDNLLPTKEEARDAAKKWVRENING